MVNRSAFGEQIVSYCRENGLPPPVDPDNFSICKDGVDLLFVSDGNADFATVWADLGLIKNYRSEEEILSKVLSISLILDPVKGFFIGLDDSSQRLMFRSRFALAGKSFGDTIAQASGQVKQWKGWLAKQQTLSY